MNENYESWAVAMCGLLDAIEMSLAHEDYERATLLVRGRYGLARYHGLEVTPMGKQTTEFLH